MNKFVATCCFSTLLIASNAQAQTGADLLDEYCLACHNFEDWAGSLALDSIDYEHVANDAESWEKVVRKLKAGMMPPAGEARPSLREIDNFVSSLENRLDTEVITPPTSPGLHRLNRTEYANAIRDLLGLDINVTGLLPLDNATEGFDNIASGLGFSPALIQGYTSAALKVSRQATGDMDSGEEAVTYNAPVNLQHDQHISSMPLGTRGGMKIEHYFPLDAEYDIVVKGRTGFGREPDVSMHIALDGLTLAPESTRKFRLSIPAGSHQLTVALLDNQRPSGVNDIYSVSNASGSITGLEIHGPYNSTDTGSTLSRSKIFTCYPEANDEAVSCAKSILSNLATRAFREPLSESDLDPLMQFYMKGNTEAGFEHGIQQGIARILIDPRFLFRFEEEPETASAGDYYAISDLELASRLSFFLWSSIPDEELLNLAIDKTLHQEQVLSQQVQRMLRDPKAEALVNNFAGQWLHLRALKSLTPETESFNDNLREAFIQETTMFFSSIMTEDRSVTDLLNADYTFLNERLAKHYGMDTIYGDYFRRVKLAPDSPRRGLLGQASILTITSTASRTSPVIRGSWILENLLHAPVPAPPPGVETNLDGDGSVVLKTSVRERLAIHRDNPSCNSCHSVIDPVGFALENFDMIGAWREFDGDSPVDSSGTLVDGTAIRSASDLREALMQRSELFVSTFTEKMLTYALGRKLEYYDMPTVRSIIHTAAANDYRFSSIIDAIVSSDVFLERTGTKQSSATLAQQAK